MTLKIEPLTTKITMEEQNEIKVVSCSDCTGQDPMGCNDAEP